MPGDALRKVKAGDPLQIPAPFYNGAVDVINAFKGGQIGGGIRADAARGRFQTVTLACNASGEAAPRFGVGAIAPRTINADAIEFVKPGDIYAAGVYCVLLEPIPSAGLGLVAVGGGPYSLSVDGVAVLCGDGLGPQTDSWNASTSGNPLLWNAVTNEADDVVQAVFNPFPYASYPGYDEETTQALTHESGVLTWGGLSPGYDGSLTEIGSTNENETADTTSWQRAGYPSGATLDLIQLWRMAYNDAGDETLYAFYRTTTFDDLGIYAVSEETRVTIDTPGECP